jgi:ABC-type Fe3+/spermidine/putrescine transport system ATPase subunit
MREEIRRIHSETRITTVYVTHDQKEALSLADRIAVLHEGRLEQLGTPREIYRSPASRFVADFIGETNWFSGRVTGGTASELRLETELGDLRAPPKAACQAGMAVQIGIRPEAVKIGSGEVNAFATRIRHVSYLGDTEQYILEVGSGRQVKAFEQNPLLVREAGNLLTVHVRPEDVLVVLEK